VREVIDRLGDLVAVLAKAKPTEKTNVYADLGITLTYRPARANRERRGGAGRVLKHRHRPQRRVAHRPGTFGV
jgi:hypothetical protein